MQDDELNGIRSTYAVIAIRNPNMETENLAGGLPAVLKELRENVKSRSRSVGP